MPAGRTVLPLALIAALALIAVGNGSASSADAGIQNQVTISDPVGDNGNGQGVDLSGLTMTSYTDGSISISVSFANTQYLETNETVQIFVDLNDDGTPDLNFSVWPSFDPSYLAKWTGSAWSDVRQLPELVQSPGSITVHEQLSELQSDGAVPVAGTIQVAVGAWIGDLTSSLPASAADDWIPSATSWAEFPLKPAPTTSSTPTTTTATTAPAVTGSPGTSRRTGSGSTSKITSPAVTIEPLGPFMVLTGHDLHLKVLLKSKAGALRLFKVCTALPPSSGVQQLTLCRSSVASGRTPVALSITYRMAKAGTVDIAIDGSAGTAKATATAVVHVKP